MGRIRVAPHPELRNKDYSDVPEPRFRYRENISQVTVAKTRNDGDGGNKGKRL